MEECIDENRNGVYFIVKFSKLTVRDKKYIKALTDMGVKVTYDKTSVGTIVDIPIIYLETYDALLSLVKNLGQCTIDIQNGSPTLIFTQIK
jgi:hypothetical protein